MTISPLKNIHIAPQQKQAWIAILGLVIFLGLLLFLGAGRILIPIFPLSSIAVGIFLYLRAPELYVGFTWWLWFLGVFVRRVIDYQSNDITPGIYELTPIAVTMISFATLLRHLPKTYNRDSLPFILCLGSIFYSFLNGLIQRNSLNVVVYFALRLSSPILFSFHLFINWRDYPSYRQTIQRAFLWGVLVMGVYGIWQFSSLPEWDKFWLDQIGKSLGAESNSTSEYFGRVFSTALAPQHFAGIMIAGLLLLLCNKDSPINFAATGIGYLTFLLSRSRAGWMGWLIGLFFFIPSLNSRLKMRVFVVIVLSSLLVIPLTFIEPFSTIIGSRLETFSNLEDDHSLNVRQEGYNELLNEALAEVFGRGAGFGLAEGADISVFDGAVLPMLFSLGWFGVLPFLVGTLLLLYPLFLMTENRFDAFSNAARAITLGIAAQIGFNFIFVGQLGMVFWGFLGIALASCKYYLYQRTLEIKR